MESTFLKSTPEPGDGAFLLQNAITKRRRNRRGYETYPMFMPTKDNAGYQAGSGTELELESGSFLRPTYEVGKEQTSLHSRSRVHEPRTMGSAKLLSSTIPNQSPSSPDTPRDTLLTSEATDADNAPDCNAISLSKQSASFDETMVIPPHLRPKKAHSTSQTSKRPSTSDATTPKDTSTFNTTDPTDTSKYATMPRKDRSNDGFKLTAVEPENKQKPDTPPTPPSSNSKTADITEKLRQLDLGIKVTDPEPMHPSRLQLSLYSSSSEDDDQNANLVTSKPKQATNNTAKATLSSGAPVNGVDGLQRQPAHGGRGGPRRGAFARSPPPQPRDLKWPKNSEMAADPHRWDIKWDKQSSPGSIDSVQADSGYDGNKKRRKDIDSETGWKLTGWDGDWAPVSLIDLWKYSMVL